MINLVQLAGALVADPEVRDLQSGALCADFTIATKSVRYDKQAEADVVDSCFIRCQAWETAAEAMVTLFKGSVVLVVGQLTQQEVEGRDGKKDRKTKVRVLTVQVVRTPSADRAVVSAPGDDSYPG